MATFYNQATLTYNGNTTTSNVTTGELVEVLSATKTPLVDTYEQGGDVTYIISIVNSGTTPYSGLTISDNLGAYTFNAATLVPLNYVAGSLRYYVNGILQTTPTVTAGPPLTVTGINVPAGGNAMIIFETTANTYAPLTSGATIDNTATISGVGLSTPVTALASVAPSSSAALSISKTLTPNVVAENGQLTYTFVIQNTGNTAATATDNLSVTDSFNPILTNISVSYNGTAWTEGTNYTYNTTTGAFATVPGQITVPAATITQDPTTGAMIVTPGVSTLTVTGTVS